MALIHIKASPGEARGHKSRKHQIITQLNQVSALISMQHLPGKKGRGKVKTHISTDNQTSRNKTTLQNDTEFLPAHTKLSTIHYLLWNALQWSFPRALWRRYYFSHLQIGKLRQQAVS